MKRPFILGFVLALAAALCSPAALHAQVPTQPPTPTPDPQLYTDDGMTFRAPEQFRRVLSRSVGINDLGADQPQVLALWAYPDKENPRTIAIAAEADSENVDGWDGTFEQQVRQNSDSVLFRNKQHFALKNGMPALFMTMTTGEGFDVKKSYIVLWSDSVRGMLLQLTARADDISDAQAKAWLSDVSAVRYPVYR